MSIPKSACNLLDAIRELMEAKGVESYYCIVSDPDSHLLVTTHDGTPTWKAGALTLELEALKRHWVEDLSVEDGTPTQ